MKFSEKLKETRKRMGLSQGEAAKLAGITNVTFCQYEHGRREPSLSTLVKIASVLDVSVDYLLGAEKDCDWWIKTANYLLTQSQQEIVEILDDASLLEAVYEYLVEENRFRKQEENA